MKTQLILDAIADTEELGVSDAELTEHVITQAQRYGVSPQEFAQQLTQGGNLPALVADVRRSKALATVLERAHVTDASGRTGRPGAPAAAPAGGERRGRGGRGAGRRAAAAGRRPRPASATSIRPIGS